jgi:hypothetical protein
MNKAKNWLMSIVVNLLFLSPAIGQKHFEPGFMVNLQNDTVKGLIENQNKFRVPDSMMFKENSGSKTKIFHPESIRAFSVSGNRFVSAEIRIDQLNREKQIDSDQPPVLKTVFLLVLADGNRNLYCYADKTKKGYFFIKGADGYELLVYKEYMDTYKKENETEFTSILKKDKKYLGQLTVYFQDCPAIQKYLGTTAYNDKSLTGLYSKYYKSCGEQQASYIKQNQKAKLSLGLMGGVSFSSVEFIADSMDIRKITTRADYSVSKKPAFGIYSELMVPYNHGKWSIRVEALYNAVLSKGDVKIQTAPEYYSIYHNTFEYSYIGTHLFIKYSQPVGKMQIFADGGIRYNFQISGSHTMIIEDHLYGNISSNPSNQTLESTKTESGFATGLGIAYKRFSLEARYNFSMGFTNYQAFTSKLNEFNVLLGFRVL